MKSTYVISFFLSLCIHGALFAFMCPLDLLCQRQPMLSARKPIHEVKISTSSQRNTYAVFDSYRSVSGQGKAIQSSMPAYVDTLSQKMLMKQSSTVTLDKPDVTTSLRNEIVISDISSADILFLKNNPGYKSYYDTLRSKYYATARKLYTVKDIGDVRLTFVLSRNGKVLEIASSSENQVLKDLSERIVRESSPFPSLPPGTTNETCRFSILVTFKGE